MKGIYPDWVGPTVEYRYQSRFPSWVNLLGEVLPVDPEAFAGGVLVLANTYGAITRSVATGFESIEAALTVEVLSNPPGIAMVARVVSAILAATQTAVAQVSQSLGYGTGPTTGAEVTDKEPGTDE